MSLPSIQKIIDAQQIEAPPQGHSYQMKDGVIYHESKIWVPPCKRTSVIEQFYNMALYHHPGVKRTVGIIRRCFSWVGIQVDVSKYIKSCLSCQRLRPGTECLQGLVSSHPVEGPFSRVYMDIYEFTIEKKAYKCLTMIDHHTKWAEVRLINNKSAVTLAETFATEWVYRFGCPSTLIIDH